MSIRTLFVQAILASSVGLIVAGCHEVDPISSGMPPETIRPSTGLVQSPSSAGTVKNKPSAAIVTALKNAPLRGK